MIPRGLYAVTRADDGEVDDLTSAVEQALRGGAVMVQYRNKTAQWAVRIREAEALNTVCRRFRVPLIVNDDLHLAKEVRAAGVHVGKDDDSVIAARAFLGAAAIVGASCYNSLGKAVRAERDGADYIAFGSFFPSPTKPDAVRAPIELLGAAKRELTVPVVAIGGINTLNAAGLVEAGADLVAVIDALFGHGRIESAAREFTDLYQTQEERKPIRSSPTNRIQG